MKKSFSILIAVTLVFGFLFTGTSLVSAGHIVTPPTIPDPTAVASTDNSSMTSEVLAQTDLPGTTQLSSGKLAPLGFIAGFAQYGGNGLEVSDLVKPTTATVCFPFRNYNFKWTGSIYKWEDSAWVSVATTFPKDGDGVVNWACTSGAGNGIYSLIIWYIGPPEQVPTRMIFN